MKVRWTKSATSHWEESLDYIDAENPTAANRMAERVVDVIQMLATHPYAGRVRRNKITRQFAVPQSPLVIAYEVNQPENILWVVAVFDGRRRWPKSFPKE
jgi:plasmid stabilization system protein ParE